MSLGNEANTGNTLTTDGVGEFWCPFCQQRCTRNRTSGIEYGHALDCLERPADLDNPNEK